MTHILLEIEHIENIIETFVMKHLHMGSYAAVTAAKADLHGAIIAADATAKETAVIEPVMSVIPDEQPDAAAPFVETVENSTQPLTETVV